MSAVYLILREKNRDGRIFSCLIEHDRLIEVHICGRAGSLLGNIYVGKVKNVLKNIDAAFVEIAGGQTCFLPLSTCENPVLTNRRPDGRLLAGDDILVQVSKDAVKTKDPQLTARLSLTGSYCTVFIGSGQGFRYSHKLTQEQRDGLKSGLEDVRLPEGISVVIRTRAGQPAALSSLREEIAALAGRAQKLISVGKTRTVYSLLSEELPDYLRHLREAKAPAPERIVTDDPGIFTEIQSWLAAKPAGNPPELTLYRDEQVSLGRLYGLEAKMQEAFSKKVWLKSGGYLVIEPTEALTVIDVNSGKYAGKKQTEETWRLINGEAADETARQLRLRNLSGIILVDFISMRDKQASRELLSRLRSRCEEDPVTCRVVDMTALGLIEITRKKVERPLAEQLALQPHREDGA